jgi:hypothetical protein
LGWVLFCSLFNRSLPRWWSVKIVGVVVIVQV